MNLWTKNVNVSTGTYKTDSYEKYRSYDRFCFVKDYMRQNLKTAETFLDVGCAKGEFIWSIKDEFNHLKFTAVEIDESLISMAREQEKLKDVNFICADAQNLNLYKEFDIVLMNGVHSIFDDIEQFLPQVNKHLKPLGWGYIFGGFTEADVDVLIRHRNNAIGSSQWESGLNMFSLNTMRRILDKTSNVVNIYPFELSVDLGRSDNPLKSFTIMTCDQKRLIMNGANIIHQFYLIEYQKKSG